jgi:DNA primase
MGYALVTEGYMDVVALAQLGFPNAVATLGTACTNEHVQKLFRFTDSVVFSFDGDNAGRRAARKALDGALPFATDVRSIKFLFLPQEHDPDSFIRANGKEAFARYVSEATPLSRFLIDAAREGCDLNTAEGRAHLASNAKPLWTQLPEGALKLQLLSEIADLVQLTNRELGDLWVPPAAPARSSKEGAWRKSKDGGGTSERFGQRNGTYTPRQTGQRSGSRAMPASRADHATRIVLSHTELWESLSSEDHGLLCGLPAPHGPVFAWLESQLHEHGPMAWEALREGLQGHEAQDLVLRLMSGSAMPTQISEPSEDAVAELRDLLNRLLVEHLKEQETWAIEASKADPAALVRYRELQTRRRQLEQASSQTP